MHAKLLTEMFSTIFGFLAKRRTWFITALSLVTRCRSCSIVAFCSGDANLPTNSRSLGICFSGSLPTYLMVC